MREYKKIAGLKFYIYPVFLLLSVILCVAILFLSKDSLKAVEVFIPNIYAKYPIDKLSSDLVFIFILLFFVSPIYQGTIRYSAYLVEEKCALNLFAVFFYFKNPRLYFSCILLSVRLAFKRILWAVCFYIFPLSVFIFSNILLSDYYREELIGSVLYLLSLMLFASVSGLYFIFIRRYRLVRYLFALGRRRGIFKASVRFSKSLPKRKFRDYIPLYNSFYIKKGLMHCIRP
jgi:hypothetical protein